jgi:hypothetical protein
MNVAIARTMKTTKDLCDAGRAGGDPAESEQRGDQCDDQEDDRVVKHDEFSSQNQHSDFAVPHSVRRGPPLFEGRRRRTGVGAFRAWL